MKMPGLDGFPKKRRTRRSDLLDVTVVRSATAAHYVQLPKSSLELRMLLAELGRISDVELG
jgi:hypothetical protein